MKKLTISFAAVCVTIVGIAQSTNNVTVHLGSIPTSVNSNGKTQNVKTTRAEILRNPKLATNTPGTTIRQFTISFLPKGREFYGPFTIPGDQLPDDIKTKINEFSAGSKVFIENIKVSVNGETRTAQPILLSYSN
ncbi:MAG: hypothetical protein V4649_06300 [Bacteroidota bacterium]